MPGNQQFREETDEEFLARLAERHAQKAARRTARIARLEAAGVLVLPLPKRGRLANARKADLDELSIFELRSAMLDAEAELLRREAAMAMRRLEIAK